MKRIYFDYAATTPVDPAVIKEMQPYFGDKFGNPGSLHFFGQEAIKAVDTAREKIAKAIGADFREIIFTGSATEANNLALRGVVKDFYSSRRESVLNRKISPLRIVVSEIEHESILETTRDLEKEGIEAVYLPVGREGIVDLKKLKSTLNERTVLVSIMYANNEIGTIQNVSAIAEIIKEFRMQNLEYRKRGINSKSCILNPKFYPLFHTDAVQAFQFLDCDVRKLGVDLMTLSAHKIYGPKGIGALYIRQIPNTKSHILNPILTGGGQEFGLRSGTENVPSIVGFAKAVELAVKNREGEFSRQSKLRDCFWKNLKKLYKRVELNGAVTRLPNNLNIYFPDFRADDLLIKLDMAGVATSAGSACAARTPEPSHVLKALNLPDARVRKSIRFSLGKFTKKNDIDTVLSRMKNI